MTSTVEHSELNTCKTRSNCISLKKLFSKFYLEKNIAYAQVVDILFDVEKYFKLIIENILLSTKHIF